MLERKKEEGSCKHSFLLTIIVRNVKGLDYTYANWIKVFPSPTQGSNEMKPLNHDTILRLQPSEKSMTLIPLLFKHSTADTPHVHAHRFVCDFSIFACKQWKPLGQMKIRTLWWSLDGSRLTHRATMQTAVAGKQWGQSGAGWRGMPNKLSNVELDFDKEPRMPHLDRVISLALDGTDIQITSRSFFPVVGVRTTTYWH